MSERICVTEGCQGTLYARGMCKRCYERAYRAGLPAWNAAPRHRLSQVDEVAKTATCVVCGSVKIVVRGPGHGNQCGTLRRRDKATYRAKHLSKQYGLTVDDYDRMWTTQGGRCSLCGKEAGRLSIDHDHSCCPHRGSCGKCVRGLLCRCCNLGLGYFYDNPKNLRIAAAYLER